jgi:hypothetical protein
MNDPDGERLISDLLANPRKFNEDGRAYALLQFYFDGFPLETLRLLLRSDDVFVQRSASFIASELGSEARSLVDDAIPLLSSMDLHVSCYAMEVLTVCCDGEHAEKFVHVVRMLESDDEFRRNHAMYLVSNADVSQLEAARRVFEAPNSHNRTHEHGLTLLVGGDRLQPTVVTAMMHNTDPLIRRYGVIAAKRLLREFPHLIAEARSSDDSDLRKFYQDVVNQHAERP